MKKYFSIMILLTFTIMAKGFPIWYYEIKDKKFVREFFSNDFLLNFNKKTKQESKIKLLKIANKYGIDKFYDKEEFFKRVDIVPISLALAQAAIESAWGNSRFTKIANNIFGQWTFKGKGVVPKNRDSGKKHKIKIFNSLQDSIIGYLLNLNTHYKNFNRLIASKTLNMYAETRKEYIRLLKQVIN